MFREFVVDKIVEESTTIKSFYLSKANGEAIEEYLPGQFVAIAAVINEHKLVRNYTLSDAPNKGYFRLTVKREDQGALSRYLHDSIQEEDILLVSQPGGRFHLDVNADSPIVLISGGVGITPMLSMAEYATVHQPDRPIHFLHSSTNISVQPMQERLKEMKNDFKHFNLTVFHTAPTNMAKGVDYDIEGVITKDHIKINLSNALADYYLCGPTAFMEAMYSHLIELGVSSNKIHYEFFGEGKSLGVTKEPANNTNTQKENKTMKVTFSKSDIVADWAPDTPSILELAEANAMTPDFSCRMGTCSMCETSLISGEIEYEPAPFMEAEEGKIFICCARPVSDVVVDL